MEEIKQYFNTNKEWRNIKTEEIFRAIEQNDLSLLKQQSMQIGFTSILQEDTNYTCLHVAALTSSVDIVLWLLDSLKFNPNVYQPQRHFIWQFKKNVGKL
eukprot:TRINITY_DN3411_c0_g1_i9.p1 TRINITY_DN3411_c0_g1~~TRINITY_DN3411_c0_g1_i9.p1  ORF type:complete len:109 (+),score=13.63 TRINITY_DN3411_c0_g1_i9:30-329(+)